VIVRADLPRGIQAAQVCHAAGESSPGGLGPGTYAVVLAVPDEVSLAREEARLRAAGVALTAVHEPDPPYHGQLMALGLHPRRKEVLRRHVASLPLLK
jgi:peptidyl-tRNA hydrolase